MMIVATTTKTLNQKRQWRFFFSKNVLGIYINKKKLRENLNNIKFLDFVFILIQKKNFDHMSPVCVLMLGRFHAVIGKAFNKLIVTF